MKSFLPNQLKNIVLKTIFLLLLLVGASQMYGQKVASVSGNWSSTATWGGTSVPVAGDQIIINSGVTVTLNTSFTSSNSITLLDGGVIKFSRGFTLTVNGTIDFQDASANQIQWAGSENNGNQSTFTLGSGATLITANSTGIVGATASIQTNGSFRNVNLNTGANYEFSGAAQTMTGIPATVRDLTFTGSGVKTYSTVTTVTGNFVMSGSATATPTMTSIGGNINLSGTAVMTTGANNTVTGSLTVGSGSKLTLGGFSLSIGSTSSISGTVDTATAATGTKTFTGAVTINSGGVWNLTTTDPATSFGGGITMNGATFDNGTGAAAFSATQTLSGSVNMTFSGSVTPATATTLTNNNTGTVTVANIVLTGNFTQGTNSILSLTGATPFSGAGTFNASTNANTVNYIGAVQTVKAVAYRTLSFSGTGDKTVATGTSVSGNLTITGVKAAIGAGLTITVNSLTLGTLGTNSGTWGSTSSSATYKNNTYFTATTGVLSIGTDTRTTPTVTPTVGTYTYTGLAQGPNSATNSGTGTSYTFSYNGTGGTVYGPSATLPTNAGTYTVTVTVAASTDGFYKSNSSAATAFSILTRALSITANNGSKTYGQTYTVGSGSTAFTSSGLQNGETVGSITIASTGAVNTAAVGSYNIVPSSATAGTFNASNYSITYDNGTLTVNAASLSITANNGSKTYGQTYTVGSGSTAFTSSGLQNSETIGTITIASTGAVTTAVVGSYSIVPSAATAGTFNPGNYTITYNNGTLTVNAAPLTITANNGTKVYGTTQSTPVSSATTFGSTGLQNGETIGTVTLTYGSGALAATDAVGNTSTITPSAATGGTFIASNYSITYTSNSGTLTVTPAALTITADNASKCFGTTYALGTSAFTSVGLQNSEIIGSVTLTSSGASSGAAVGSYSIVPSAATGGTFTASNYSITYTNGTLTVNALPSAPTGTDGVRCSTGTVSLSASVGGGETVDWYDASTGGTLLLSNSASFTTPSISSTTVYYAEARNTTTGCTSSTRTAVTATVSPTSVGGSVTGGTTICSGSTSGLLTLSGNTGSVVRWEYSVSPFSSWTTIATTSTTYTSGALTQTTKFRAVVQSGVCSEANSSDTTVTVDLTSVGGTVSSAQSVCYGTEPADLTLSGNTGAVVKWQSSSDAGFSSPTDIVETSTTLSGTTIGALTANTYFRAVVQSGVCSSANSASVLITVDATTVGGTVSSNQTICSGSQPADLTLSGHVGSVIKWESSLDAGFSSPTDIIITSATLTGATIGSLTQNTYFRAVVQSGACDSLESAYVLITINDASVGGTVTGGTAICAGSTSGVLTLSGYTGTILRWESAVSPFSSWSTIANTVDTYTSGALTQTTRFRAVVQSGICSEVASAYTSVDINTTTWSSGAWNNGAPDNTKAAIITSAFISGGNDLEACSLTVNNGATVSISSGDTVTLSGALTAVTGSLVIFNNNANLIQSGSTNANSGAIIIKRNSSALMRQDYTLWSSPVAGQQLQAYSPQTLSNRFYTYNATTNLYDLVASPSTTNFATAQGYLIRMPNNHPATPTIWAGQFAGVPNNGDYSYTLTDGGAGNRFNLVGNPYPSPIDALAFIGDTNNSSAITGTLYFWRKTNNAASPTYCTWTAGGFVGNGEAQVFDPNDVIQTGQGFFVEGTGSGTVNFTNTMRINDHANQFFKMSTAIERNRIWLNATNASGLFSQTMVGYITNATQGVDATIDGKYINDGGIALTSLIGTTPYAIQGRALPFDAGDVVPMNFKVATAGDYTIAIDHVDGLFAGSQTVYLRDNTTGVIHDLTTGAYTFASEAGNFNARFDILYQLPLGYSNPVFNANEVVIYKNPANEFVVNSGNAVMASIKVFDIRGRLLTEKKNINASQTTINTGLANEVLLVQITAEDGVTVTKKVIK